MRTKKKISKIDDCLEQMNNYKRDLREVTKKHKYKLGVKGINEEHSLKEGERK
jgi:sensor histidine kinase regulating citrate/malate metabolism